MKIATPSASRQAFGLPVAQGCGAAAIFVLIVLGNICSAQRSDFDSPGAEVLTGVFEAGGVKIALLRSPQGHEIELVELPR